MKSYKPAVRATQSDSWHYNDLRFATEREALAWGHDLIARRAQDETVEAHESEDAPNYSYGPNGLQTLAKTAPPQRGGKGVKGILLSVALCAALLTTVCHISPRESAKAFLFTLVGVVAELSIDLYPSGTEAQQGLLGIAIVLAVLLSGARLVRRFVSWRARRAKIIQEQTALLGISPVTQTAEIYKCAILTVIACLLAAILWRMPQAPWTLHKLRASHPADRSTANPAAVFVGPRNLKVDTDDEVEVRVAP